jgi:DNA-binding CsgD family transcriptional regulator
MVLLSILNSCYKHYELDMSNIHDNLQLLTKREEEILQYILAENTSAQIAQLTQLSIRTVETHRKHILKKTNSKTVIGLVKTAIKLGLVKEFS